VRTRAALVALVLERLAEIDLGGRDRPGGARSLPPAPSARDVVEVVLGGLLAQLATAREQVVARYELTLEAARDEQVREALHREGRPFRESAIGLLHAAGSADPDRHGRTLVAFCEGVLFDSVVGAGADRALTADELRASLTEVVDAMLAGS
jgi:hypothetical protein